MLSIVIPIYNEQENLPQLYERLINAGNHWKDTYEVILVDDRSTDNSPAMMKEIAEKDDRFKIVTFSRNFGHQAAISAGIRLAQGDAVIIMDGDLQDPPEELSRFLEKWREGYEVVYAIRTKRKEKFFKRLAYAVFYRALNLISDINIPLDSGDFCVMDRKVVEVLNHDMPEQIRFVRGLRAFAGFKQIGVQYERAERAAGEAKYTFRKLMKLALDGIFDFSTFPLRIAVYFGFIIAIPSFLLVVFFLIHRIFDVTVFGYAPKDNPGIITLAVGIFFLSGVILIMLGVIGEYVGRIYFEVKKRPFYIIESVYSKNRQEADNKNR